MLAIFDIDGTICDTREVEGRCYVSAVEQITGIRLHSTDWTRFQEPTSSGIVRELLADDVDADHKCNEIRDLFVQLLEKEKPMFPGDFSPLRGAVDFIQSLVDHEDYSVAIATGGFDTEAEFKLRSCGLSLDDFPHATSSDTPKRRQILALAAKRAGFHLESVVYFGDAPWDHRACRELEIPFIGMGRRLPELVELGTTTVFRDFSDPGPIWNTLNEIRERAGSVKK